ncbi:MAG: ABC transporter substrate-binding protein [Erysipelotrichaceae bacterium]|nr:ABC transporter substrate-binding protein [Erysipelotrichaceae bacterium]
MKKVLLSILSLLLVFSLAGCQNNEPADQDNTVYRIGICNYVDHASLNQIVDNIRYRLGEIAKGKDFKIEINYQNCNADANLLNQIIQNFIDQKVDLMIGVATPVAMAMQAATEDNPIPVVFAAVSDPLTYGLVDSLENPGHNITGTSDYLDTGAVMNLILALKPEIRKVGLLFDFSQDASTTAINQARELLQGKGIEVVEKSGTNVSEIQIAADALIQSGVEAVFTPSDNTVMTAELSIYEALAKAGIPHFAGADSFALNGAFLGYGVDYANLGVETANMAADILIEHLNPGDVAVKTFDNGIATINTEVCAQLGYDFGELKILFEPLCTQVTGITTGENFEN